MSLPYNANTDSKKQSTNAITMTPEAQKHVRKYMQKNNNQQGIRLSVKTTGCSGFMYDVALLDATDKDDKVFSIEEDLQVAVSEATWNYVKGTCIDLKKQGLNETLIFLNPNAENLCGCGESFTVKKS